MNIITKSGAEFDFDLKYYLAGPMTGIAEYNYPAFEEACKVLDKHDIDVESPHRIDHGQHAFNSASHSREVCQVKVPVLGEWIPNVVDLGEYCDRGPDDPIHNLERGALPYQVYLKAGYRLLLQCDGIILLHGWTKSKGVRHELYIARTLGFPVYTLGQEMDYLLEVASEPS